MKASPQTTSTIVGTIPLHEAGHSVAALAVGGEAGFVYAGECGGASVAIGKTSLATMIIMAAGVSATVAVQGFETTLPRLTPPAQPAADDVSAPAMALAFLENHTTMVREGGGSDMERFDKLVSDLIAGGRIKRRKEVESRWWWWARRHATRILESRRAEVRAIAAALATRGGIDGNELQNILRGIGSNLARAPGVAPSPSHWTEGGGGVPAMMPRQTGGTANG